MATLNHTFSQWNETSPDAGALRELLARSFVWDQQRADGASQPVAINAKHEGAFLSIFRRDGRPEGFALFMPQKCGLYEVHIGFDETVGAFKVVDFLNCAVSCMFLWTDAKILAAPCPDWRMGVLRLARAVKKSLLAGAPANFEPYRVNHLARRDGEDFGATVFPFSKGEWEKSNQERRKHQPWV